MNGTAEVWGKFVQCEEERRRHMGIFQGALTRQWTNLTKSPRDGKMASLSDQMSLGHRTTMTGGPFGPICSPFFRLSRPIHRT